MDFTELAQKIGLEDDEFLELVELFMETCASDISRLQVAIDQGDTQQVVEAAHSIKGASANLGFMEISSVAKEMEQNARDDSLDGAAEAVETIKKGLDLIKEKL
ncbi:MAG: Hpt domain-containing protein [Deltaproteobacteria bacterium]|nr:Hpt domain-containing protein [Deltaproteobacteria bacterium]